jgi:hypothetical protein
MIMQLTLNEVNLLADALNGCGTSIDNDPRYLRTMCDDQGFISGGLDRLTGQAPPVDGTPYTSGLEQTIADAMQGDDIGGSGLSGLADKWGVDGGTLLRKLHRLTPAQREHIIRAIGRAWDGCDGEAWDRELMGLTRIEWDNRSPVRDN